MASVEVTATPSADGWECAVTLRDGRETRHGVHVAAADLARLDPGASRPERLVTASFEFLLEREPPESILREFDLAVIARYFPEYPREIARRMQALPPEGPSAA